MARWACLMHVKAIVILLPIFLDGLPGSGAGDVEHLPDDLTDKLPELQRYFCDSCKAGPWRGCNPSETKLCPFCQQICTEESDSECLQEDCEFDGSLCSSDQCDVCLFDDAHVCEFDNDDICVYMDYDATTRILCLCQDMSTIVVGKSCSEQRQEMSTSPEGMPTGMSTVTTDPTDTQPAGQVNLQALVIGLILTALFTVAVVFIVCFCPKSNLCKRNTSTRAVHNTELQSSPVAVNPGGGPTAAEQHNPTYEVTLIQGNHEHGKTDSRVMLDGGVQRRDHGGRPAGEDPSVVPSAPALEDPDRGAGAQGSPHYFILERDQSPGGQLCPNAQVHSGDQMYFTPSSDLGPDEELPSKNSTKKHQDNQGYLSVEKTNGNHGNDTSKADGIASPLSSGMYDHVKRSPDDKKPGNSNYSHLDLNPAYDHVGRPGHLRPNEDAVHDENLYNHLASQEIQSVLL